MPTWRHYALQFLPELSEMINSVDVDNPYMLWIYIRMEFVDAYSGTYYEESFIKRIYQFARWCFSQPRGKSAKDDLLTCVFVCFFEHIAELPTAIDDLPRWLSSEDFSVVSGVLKETMNESDYERLRLFFVDPH